jgi:hypothetical protein
MMRIRIRRGREADHTPRHDGAKKQRFSASMRAQEIAMRSIV